MVTPVKPPAGSRNLVQLVAALVPMKGEAQQLLMNWSINQEIWRSNNPAYDDGTGIGPPAHDDYTFRVSNVTATTYTLQAEASNDQVNDKSRDGSTYCGKVGAELELLNTGAKSPAGCWD